MPDFPEKLVVDVTETDIARGIPNACNRCPIALAIRRKMPGYAVEVQKKKIRLAISSADCTSWESRHYEMPREAEGFVNDFDLGNTRYLSPLSFTAVPVVMTPVAPWKPSGEHDAQLP